MFVNYRCFGVVLATLLLHGADVSMFGKESVITKEWNVCNELPPDVVASTPPAYIQLINLCVNGNSSINLSFSLVWYILFCIQKDLGYYRESTSVTLRGVDDVAHELPDDYEQLLEIIENKEK